jgi:hypothetical protein
MTARQHAARQSRLLPQAGAVVSLAAVVAGPPLLLLALVGSPLHPPASLRTADALTQAVDDQAVLWLLGAVGWLLWGHLLLALIVELARQTRGSTVRIPLPGLLFGANTALASHLIASLLLTGPAAAHGALTPAVARTPMAVTAVTATSPTPAAAGEAALPTTDPTRHAAPGTAEPDTTAAAPGKPGTRLIQCRVLPPQGRDHDTLWDIAERHLGDGMRWRDIYALNQGRLMPDGQRLTRASLIHPGWILDLPADAIALPIDFVPVESAPAHAAPVDPIPVDPVPLDPVPLDQLPTSTAAAPTADAAQVDPLPSRSAQHSEHLHGEHLRGEHLRGEHLRGEHLHTADSRTPIPEQPTTAGDQEGVATRSDRTIQPAHGPTPLTQRASAQPDTSRADNDIPDDSTDDSTEADDTVEAEDDVVTAPVVAAGLLGLAALGLLNALTRRRRVAARRRPPGVRAARPTADMLELEAQLRQQARRAEDTVVTVELALHLAARHAPAAHLRALWQHADGSFELVLTGSETGPAPAPFVYGDRGWLLPADSTRFLYTLKQHRDDPPNVTGADLDEQPRPATPFPLLLPVGSQHGSTCLINLEPLGLISLITDTPTPADEQLTSDRPAITADSVIAAWVQALASAPWADLVRTYVPPELTAVTTGLERVTALDPGSDAAGYALAELSLDQQVIVDRHASLACARRHEPNLDVIGLSLWAGFTADQLPDELLRGATDARDPNTVLLLGHHPDAHSWQLTEAGLLSIPGVAEALEPMSVAAAQQQLVLRLLEHAEDPPQADPAAPERTELLADCPPQPPPSPDAVAVAVTDAAPDADAASPDDAQQRRPDEPGSAVEPSVAIDERKAPSAGRADDVSIAGSTASTAVSPEALEVDDAAEPESAQGEPVAAAMGRVDEGPAEAAELPRSLEVNILGPLQIIGAAGDPPRRHCLEMLVYLTLHRRPVPVQSLWQAVFPDRPYDSHQLVNRMSELRRYARQKLPQIKRSYQVDEFTISDWQRFRALSEGNPSQQLEALALVRGRPFEDLRSDWMHLEGQLAEIEASIVDLAVQVGERALRQQDPDSARTAALAGLRGCPWDERLYRIAMQAAAARGATHEIHQLRRQLQLVLDDELDPDDDIQPATQQLYGTLRDSEDRQRRLLERRRNGG